VEASRRRRAGRSHQSPGARARRTVPRPPWRHDLVGVVAREGVGDARASSRRVRGRALFLEASDWVVWRLTGRLVRGACAAGYKGLWHKRMDGHRRSSWPRSIRGSPTST
jgi:hypothetical protein